MVLGIKWPSFGPRRADKASSILYCPTATMMFLVLLAQLCICTTRAAGNATSSATVSASTPVQGVYTGPLRPQVHFSPPTNFMNDPNGMFLDASRTYHLYYQCESQSPLGVRDG